MNEDYSHTLYLLACFIRIRTPQTLTFHSFTKKTFIDLSVCGQSRIIVFSQLLKKSFQEFVSHNARNLISLTYIVSTQLRTILESSTGTVFQECALVWVTEGYFVNFPGRNSLPTSDFKTVGLMINWRPCSILPYALNSPWFLWWHYFFCAWATHGLWK